MESTEQQSPLASRPSPVPVQAQPPINWAYQFQQYGVAVGVTVCIYVVIAWYLWARSGSFDLSGSNKVLADDAALLLGLVLLLGPASRLFDRFDSYVQYRKELGIMVFFIAALHGIISFFFLPNNFPLSFFLTRQLWPFIFGLAGLLLLVALFLSSRKKILAWLGPQRWWKFQNWGVRFVLLFTALHVGIMYMPRWLSWYQKGGSANLVHPEWPTSALLIGWFLAFVILIRLIEPLDKHWGRLVWFASAVLLPAMYLGTFIWGYQFIK